MFVISLRGFRKVQSVTSLICVLCFFFPRSEKENLFISERALQILSNQMMCFDFLRITKAALSLLHYAFEHGKPAWEHVSTPEADPAVWIYPLNLIRMKIWSIIIDGVLPFWLRHIETVLYCCRDLIYFMLLVLKWGEAEKKIYIYIFPTLYELNLGRLATFTWKFKRI